MTRAEAPVEPVARPLVYIAAPYSAPDPVDNTRDVILLATELWDGGQVTPVVPHLTLLWHLVSPRQIEDWYAYDLAILARSDALLRLLGMSTGADQEVEFAEDRGIRVFHSVDDLLSWAEDWTP